MKRKRIFIILSIICLFIISMFFVVENISFEKNKGDSGFDTSYDSGSSWDSGSSYDSGSSRSRSSSSSSESDSNILFLFLVGCICLYVYYSSIKKNCGPTKKENLSSNISSDIISSKISKEDYNILISTVLEFDEKKFLNDRYSDYLAIQYAWMNFDYDTLRSKLTDELYNQYVIQLDTLKVKNQKNIMSDFIFKDSAITKVSKENDLITVTIELICEFYDYIEQRGNVVRGKSNVKITHHYRISFVCNMANNIVKCPNCGAELNNNASKVCEYCRGLITGVSSNWVMSKKESLNQW